MSNTIPPRPKFLDPIANNIPSEMKELKQWVSWRYKYEETRDKWTKIPVDVNTGQNAKNNAPATWGDFEAAWAFYLKHKGNGADGVGYVFTADDGLVGIDLDHCIEDGALKDEFRWIVNSFAGTYTEVSVSGTGLHIIINAISPFDGCRRKKGDIEIFNSRCYFTITGVPYVR